MRCLLNLPSLDDSWKRHSIFHTNLKYGDKSYKLIIDNGSERNVISSRGVVRLGLKTEPIPKPFRVAWIDNTSLHITQQCRVPLSPGDFKEDVLCVVISMDVSHILLGCPWLYDHDVIIHGRSNKHAFKHEGKTILLRLVMPEPKRKEASNS